MMTRNNFVEKEMKKVDVWKIKKYVCKVQPIDIFAGKNIIVLNEDEAKEHDIYSGYRTEVRIGNKSLIAIVDVSNEMIKAGHIGLYNDVMKEMKVKAGQKIEIVHMDRPKSLGYIKKKLDKESLNEEEVRTIVDDIMDDRLGEVSAAAWVAAAYINGFTDDEVVSLTMATYDSGEHLDLGKKPVVDKHCIGGVAGNRTTMVIVPIIAAAGAYIPKTSSRSITSAAGTADTMEVLADVIFDVDEVKKMVLKAKGAIVWGGGMELAPVDDKLIKIRHPLSLDPEGMLLASILGKKKSVGAEHVLIDIPVGRGVKIPYVERGNELARHFIRIGEKLGMNIEALITDGAEPIGNGIGPVLECIDVLEVLEGRGPDDLRHKSILMSGKLLELCGKCPKGTGYKNAEKLIENGKALKKFREIIELQGGNPKIKATDIQPGEYTYDVTSELAGHIYHIDNKTMSKIARIAGSPRDSGAGIYLHALRGNRVKAGDKLFTIYAESEAKLEFAIKALKGLEPIEMRKILLGSMQ
ncbi:AMP phosphorylase [Candidatus Micrarchaeota archaeon]|nr:AMP phosphorylase [Candidatus Micrarchaeota archaeon]